MKPTPSTMAALAVLVFGYIAGPARWDPIGAVPWEPPTPLPLLEANTLLLDHGERVLEGKLLGPESFAVDHLGDGRVFSGLMSGEIVSFFPDDPDNSLRSELWLNSSCLALLESHGYPRGRIVHYELYDPAWEKMCGRPLGMKFSEEGVLLVLESYTGVIQFERDRSSGILRAESKKVLYDKAKMANDLDVDSSAGKAFFSESSPRWGRDKIVFEIISARRTGRLLALDLTTQKVTELVSGIPMTNGVTLTHDKSAVLFNAGPAVHAYDRKAKKYLGIVLDNLPCMPDNIRRHPSDGATYLLACGARRAQPFSLTDALAPYPFLREILVLLVANSQLRLLGFIPVHSMVHRIKITLEGGGSAILSSVQDPTGSMGYSSEAEKIGNYLYVGTWKHSWITRMPWNKTGFDSEIDIGEPLIPSQL